MHASGHFGREETIGKCGPGSKDIRNCVAQNNADCVASRGPRLPPSNPSERARLILWARVSYPAVQRLMPSVAHRSSPMSQGAVRKNQECEASFNSHPRGRAIGET